MSKKLSSAQKVFNKVTKHLLTQNAKSVMNNSFESYAYRGKDNLRCAIGVLITNDNYSTSLEGYGATNNDVKLALYNSYDFCGENITLIRELQIIHDNEEVFNWRHKLEKLAKTHKLSMPKV